MPVLRSLLEPGKELAGALTVPLIAGVGTRSPLVINETHPVYFAPQYKTRYPFYRWVGWSTCDVFFLLLWDSNQCPDCPLGYKPKALPPGHHTLTHSHTLTHTHTHTHSLSHIVYCRPSPDDCVTTLHFVCADMNNQL